ncbi:substrate-binding domain-containing protein [Kitasatospora sp. NPDC056327]|uniref:substrate-binding domain-containing protein n=1 Tax=Kitasatospora sp. NPDC056327 TaxID=3345785 RepID=UPI0035DD9DFE
MLRILARLAAALAVTAAPLLGTGVAAATDPPTTPIVNSLVGVGADVDQDLYTRFATAYDASLTAAGDTRSFRFHSWGSDGSSPITPKLGAAAIARPRYGDAGITALANTTTATLDFARSARRPRSNDRPAVFLPMARDALTWAAPLNGNAPRNLTTQQLANIYKCFSTDWGAFNPSAPLPSTIRPFLPPPGSDLRALFLAALGIFNTDEVGPCVGTVPGENDGTDPLLNGPNAIVPYSVARHLAQTYKGYSRPGSAPGQYVLRDINGIAPLARPESEVELPYVPNIIFVNTAFGYPLSTVVRPQDWAASTAQGNALRAVFGPNGWICKDPVAQREIRNIGFLWMPPGRCGMTWTAPS